MAESTNQFKEKLNWYLTLVTLFLFVIVPPILCSLFYLSQVPEVIWERDDNLTYDRIWMYRERRPLGLAYQSQRVIQEYSPTEVCVENSLTFFLWGRAKEAKEASSSRKMALGEGGWQTTGEACE
jgi:hypothetical protein